MYEQDDAWSGRKQDVIEIDDFVFAATGARVRRLTTPDGEHWFPAVDVAVNLGYANTRQAVLWHVAAESQQSLEDLARSVYGVDASSKVAGHGLKRSMRMVNLRGLITLINGCTKPECAPFKAWVSEVIETVQREGSYTLRTAPMQPAPTGGTAYLMPQEVADAIVRLEERNIRADEALAVADLQRIEETRRTNAELGRGNERLGAIGARVGGVQDVLVRIADTLDLIAERLRPPTPAPAPTPTPAPAPARAPAPQPPPVPPPVMNAQLLLAVWRERNLVVTEDVHAVAACLAPALVRGPVPCRLEEVAERTGLTLERVHDCLRMLIKRGCMRQVGSAADGMPVYALP
ncbi:Bro-N domain-containing protein [Streptomyces sp. NPDC090108]|uniref:BRO-N domain-containing protein n=1 Tax=Streptomyces sp. NPDC090108 TaxID=3365947 RepID=UPI003808D3C3